MIKDGIKCLIANQKVFENLGLKEEDVYQLNDNVLTKILTKIVFYS